MNLSTIKPFVVQSEAVTGCGEDSGFVRSYENGLVVTGVFDGCGGIGGRRYPEVNGRTGAYIGSQVAAYAADTFFTKFFSAEGCNFIRKNSSEQTLCVQKLREYISGKLFDMKKKFTHPGSIQIGGSLNKSFPTTVSIIASASEGNYTVVEYIWAGDSRGYMLDDQGLCQLTTDDIDMNADDAFLNLREDGILTEVANGDKPFELHSGRLRLSSPVILINATDGCFAYFLTPMDFENVILETMAQSADPAQWQTLLNERIKEITGDDYTLTAACYGFDDFEDMKKYYSERQMNVRRSYIERQGGADEERLKRLWDDYKTTYYREKLILEY